MSDAIDERAKHLVERLVKVEAEIDQITEALLDPDNVHFITTGEGTSRAQGFDRLKGLQSIRDDIVKSLADIPVDATYQYSIGTDSIGQDVGEDFVT